MPQGARLRIRVLATLLALSLPGAAGARDLFSASISIGGGPAARVGTDRAWRVPDFFDEASLAAIDPGYDPSQAVAASLDLRGLAASVSFDAFSNTLRFQVPGAGIDVSFDGSTRDEARESFEDWLQGEFGSALAPGRATTQLLQALVARSPVDPVAGNPNSLQSRMFDADFRMATSGPLRAYGEGGVVPSFFGLRLGGGIYRADDFSVYAIDLPFQFRFGLGERLGLVLDLPATFTSTEGAWAGMGSSGLGLWVKPTGWWSLAPAARFGGVGSLDLGGLAVLYSGTLTSHVRFPLGPLAVGVANMGGVSKTLDGIEISGYELDYDLENWVTRNGGYLEGSLGAEVFGTGLGWRLQASDIRFFGDELFLNDYREVGAVVAAGLPIGGLQVGLSYLFGHDYAGFSARLGLRF